MTEEEKEWVEEIRTEETDWLREEAQGLISSIENSHERIGYYWDRMKGDIFRLDKIRDELNRRDSDGQV